MIMTSQYQIS